MEAGRAAELPWWVAYFAAADRCHCPPWELIATPTPRAFWARAGAILAAAEGAARAAASKPPT